MQDIGHVAGGGAAHPLDGAMSRWVTIQTYRFTSTSVSILDPCVVLFVPHSFAFGRSILRIAQFVPGKSGNMFGHRAAHAC